MKTGGGVLLCLALAVATPGLADGTGGILTMDLQMRVQSINAGEWFPAVVNPDYGELYSLGLVNTSGTFTGDPSAPDTFLFLDLPVYAIVPWQADLITPLPDPFVPWYDKWDPLFGDGTDLATRNFSLAPVGRLDVELTRWSLDLDAGLAGYFDFGVYVDDLAGESIDIQIDAAFTVPPSGPPDYLWYGVSDFWAFDPWDDRVSLSLGYWPVDNGWPGTTLDKTFFPLSAPPPGPVPPCPPPPYAPGGGTILNPRFEEPEDDHLSGWYHTNYGDSPNSLAEAVNLAAEGDPPDYAAHLRAQGEFVEDGDGFSYARGDYSMDQGVYLPLDATTVSFMYLAKIVDAIDGTTEARVNFGDGGSETALPDTAGAWVRYDIPVASELLGRTSLLVFNVVDESWQWWDQAPPADLDSVDLWLDYCHVDGTAPIETRWAQWHAPAGGAWTDAVNWIPQEVPDNALNAMQNAYDILYYTRFPGPGPGEGPGGWGPVVLGGNQAVAVQQVDYYRPTDFVIESGSSLRVYDYFSVSAGRWVVEPGAAIDAQSQLMFLQPACFAVTGDGSGTPSITVRHSFSMAAEGTVHDAAIEAGHFWIRPGATLTVTGQSRLAVLQYGFIVYGALDMTGGLIEAPNGLQVAYGGQLTATGGTRIEVMGEHSYLTAINNGTITMTDGEIHAQTVAVQGGGTMGLYDVDVYAAAFQVYDGVGAGPVTFYADADTVFHLNGEFLAAPQDRSTVDLTDATLVFYGAGGEHRMYVGGLDGAGFDDNVSVGTLRLEDGGTLGLVRVWSWPAGDYAQYVETLVLSDNSTLNLGYHLYYKNLVLGANVTVNGPGSLIYVPEPATLALLALGASGALLRRRRA